MAVYNGEKNWKQSKCPPVKEQLYSLALPISTLASTLQCSLKTADCARHFFRTYSCAIAQKCLQLAPPQLAAPAAFNV